MVGGAAGVWYMSLFAKQGFVYELYGVLLVFFALAAVSPHGCSTEGWYCSPVRSAAESVLISMPCQTQLPRQRAEPKAITLDG